MTSSPSPPFSPEVVLSPEEVPTLEEVLAAVRLRRTIERADAIRASQAGRGGLINFIQHFWTVLEPNTPFVGGPLLEAMCEHLEAVAYGQISRLIITVPPGSMKSLLTNVFFPAWMWGPMGMASHRFIGFSYSASLTERDNRRFRDLVISPEYRHLWGDRFELRKQGETLVSNSETGFKLASSVGGVGTGARADLVVIDDAHNVKEAESEVVRTATVRWFRESMLNRLNDMRKSAIVIIQQRVHSGDIPGVILDEDMDYEHLNIPMEYEPDLHCKTSIGWEDWRTRKGELAWPERFPPVVVARLKREMGQYAFCNPGEAPVLMGDMSLRPIADVRVGDTVIGFTLGNTAKRARLKPAIVKGISVSRQPVVKITMESGAVIRCTPNHKWWTARNDRSHPPYKAAGIGSTLSRVCPAELPRLSPEDHRLGGWLGGFFDGEGSVALNHRNVGSSSPLLSFSQGDNRNLPLCEKLEQTLTHFGFNWGVSYKNPQKAGATHKLRMYWLKMTREGRASRFPLYQMFLHVAQPVKWRERLIEAARTGRLYTQGERVKSIEPDGQETVYGLETETGNYVVWGLASSNSSQYQQMPSPRGGGILKREWWRPWDAEACKINGVPPNKFPVFSYIVASVDTAYTSKEENDPSACTVWGVWTDAYGVRRIMLIQAWAERLELHDLVRRIETTCLEWQVSRILIEGKASGHSVAQELQRRTMSIRDTIGQDRKKAAFADFAVQLVRPDKDKVSRVHAIVPIFQSGLVYAPVKEWAEAVIGECERFPRDVHEDRVDSTSMALAHLRLINLAELPDERDLTVEDYRPPKDFGQTFWQDVAGQ